MDSTGLSQNDVVIESSAMHDNSAHDIGQCSENSGYWASKTTGTYLNVLPPASLAMKNSPTARRGYVVVDDDEDGKVYTCDCVDALSACANCCLLLTKPRGVNTMRFANSVYEHERAGQEFKRGIFHKLHLRFTAKFKYHPLQRNQNLIRRFSASEALVDHMQKIGGTKYFYYAVCGRPLEFPDRPYFSDFTTLQSLSSVKAAASYLQDEATRLGSKIRALTARRSFERGFSRNIDVFNLDDWQNFRMELMKGHHEGKAMSNDTEQIDVLPIAVSYKAKEVKLTRRMFLLEDDGNRIEGATKLSQLEKVLTTDFVDDFRWSQLVRTCMQIAKFQKYSTVRLWIDRLVTMELRADEKKRIYEHAQWWDFGILPYAVCPVVRLYEEKDLEFTTDFWRKIETVLGVAGRGLFVDDYLLRVYDKTIYYGPQLYKRLGSGISQLGGDGVYLRAATLALATAVLTDGITVKGMNEDIRTVNAISGFKAWALRTIGEGAYSSSHSAMIRTEEPYVIGYEQFRTIVTWEAFVSTCSWLNGSSYMDLSYQRSQEWEKSGHWDGVIEWVGMVKEAVIVEHYERIIEMLSNSVSVRTWAATTGHAASMLNFEVRDNRPLGRMGQTLKRSLVVALSRFSNSNEGHVSAVAEATGLRGGSILPGYLRFANSTNRFQNVEKYLNPQASDQSSAKYVVRYEYAPILFLWSPAVWWSLITYLSIVILASMVLGIIGFPVVIFIGSLTIFLVIVCLVYCLYFGLRYVIVFHLKWPWADDSGYGEAVFDNVLMHSLFNTGIKVFDYRELKPVKFTDIKWN